MTSVAALLQSPRSSGGSAHPAEVCAQPTVGQGPGDLACLMPLPLEVTAHTRLETDAKEQPRLSNSGTQWIE